MSRNDLIKEIGGFILEFIIEKVYREKEIVSFIIFPLFKCS